MTSREPNQSREVTNWARGGRLVVIIVLATVVGTLVGVFLARSSAVLTRAQSVSVSNVGALRSSITQLVVASKIDGHAFSVITKVSPTDRRWQFFTVSWSDHDHASLTGFGYWRYGQWELTDTGYSRPGCTQSSKRGPLNLTVPKLIVASFGLHC